MVMEGDLTWGGEHTVQCTDDVVWIVCLKPVHCFNECHPINLIKRKTKQTNKKTHYGNSGTVVPPLSQEENRVNLGSTVFPSKNPFFFYRLHHLQPAFLLTLLIQLFPRAVRNMLYCFSRMKPFLMTCSCSGPNVFTALPTTYHLSFADDFLHISEFHAHNFQRDSVSVPFTVWSFYTSL